MTKSVSGQKKPTCWQILPPPIWAAYTAYVTSYQHKLTYLLRTTPSIEGQLKKIDVIVRHKLIPATIGGHIINVAERIMLSLPKRLEGLDLKIIAVTAENEYKDSTRITSKKPPSPKFWNQQQREQD